VTYVGLALAVMLQAPLWRFIGWDSISQRFALSYSWLPLIIPGLFILSLLACECCVWGVCQLGSRIWTRNATPAAEADLRLRARCLGFIYFEGVSQPGRNGVGCS
jgi:hypothetical protein